MSYILKGLRIFIVLNTTENELGQNSKFIGEYDNPIIFNVDKKMCSHMYFYLYFFFSRNVHDMGHWPPVSLDILY